MKLQNPVTPALLTVLALVCCADFAAAREFKEFRRERKAEAAAVAQSKAEVAAYNSAVAAETFAQDDLRKAREDQRKADTALATATAALRKTADADPEMLQTADAARKADQARTAVTDKLRASAESDPAVAAAMKKRQDADATLAALRGNGSAEQITQAATNLAAANKAEARAFDQIIGEHPDLVAANKNCVETSKKLADAQAKVRDQIKADANIASLSKAAQDARNAVTAAQKKYDEAHAATLAASTVHK